MPKDAAAITDAWLDVLDVPLPDRTQHWKLVAGCISGGISLVDETESGIGAALLARLHGRIWRRKQQATVVVWFNRCSRQGTGIALLRRFLAVAKGRKAVQDVAVYSERGYDDRLSKVLARYGFSVSQVVTLAREE